MQDSRDRVAGSLLVLASALMFSLSGVLTKAIAADGWVIVCWRGLIGGLAIALYVEVRRGAASRNAAFGLGWHGWLLATVGSAASITFIYSFKLTYVANVAIIYATAPFMAAALGWWLMRESVAFRTMMAAAVSIAGVGVIVSGGLGAFNLRGDLLAVLMTFGNAVYMVLIRKFSHVPVVWAGGASSLQLFVVGWFLGDPLAVSGQDVVLLVVFGLAFAIAVVLWTEGTRLIPAAQSGLLGSAETPFAILLAWMFLAELPPQVSFIGGSIVILAVVWHALLDVRASRSRK